MRYFLSAAFRNLWESKVTSIFTLVTLSVALGFLGTYLAVFMNMKAALGAVTEKFPLTVFLKDGVSQAQMDSVKSRLKADPSVASFGFTSKEQALQYFKSSKKADASLIESLGGNPLPASFDVTLRAESSPESVIRLAKDLRALPGVDEVQYLQEEAGRLRSVLGTFRLAGLVLGLGVLLGVVFISYSTLRLAVLRHSDEIEVMKLMGATRLFIMGPFLAEGLLQGLIAAALSLGLLYGLLSILSANAATALLTPGGLAFLPLWALAGMVGAGGLLGLTGSFFAFFRTLRM